VSFATRRTTSIRSAVARLNPAPPSTTSRCPSTAWTTSLSRDEGDERELAAQRRGRVVDYDGVAHAGDRDLVGLPGGRAT
jgi:hypothetical protein